MPDFTLFLTYFVTCAVAAATGSLFKPGDWYAGLAKPGWTPPNLAFPIIWTTLYLLMAFAAARVAMVADSGQALALWSLQIALNTLWSPVFFGLKRMGAGLVVIVALWLAVAATSWAFLQIDLLSGVVMLPYLAWISVAAALNFTVLRLNPKK